MYIQGLSLHVLKMKRYQLVYLNIIYQAHDLKKHSRIIGDNLICFYLFFLCSQRISCTNTHTHTTSKKFRSIVHYSVSNCFDIFELGIKSFDLQLLKILPQKSEPVNGCNMSMSTYHDLGIVLISLHFNSNIKKTEKDILS